MRAITYERFGPAGDVLALEEVPDPAPARGEVLVRLRTSGVNRPTSRCAQADARA